MSLCLTLVHSYQLTPPTKTTQYSSSVGAAQEMISSGWKLSREQIHLKYYLGSDTICNLLRPELHNSYKFMLKYINVRYCIQM